MEPAEQPATQTEEIQKAEEQPKNEEATKEENTVEIKLEGETVLPTLNQEITSQ